MGDFFKRNRLRFLLCILALLIGVLFVQRQFLMMRQNIAMKKVTCGICAIHWSIQ